MLIELVKNMLSYAIEDFYSKSKINKEIKNDVDLFINNVSNKSYEKYGIEYFVKNDNFLFVMNERYIQYNDVDGYITTVKINLKDVYVNKIFIESDNNISLIEYSYDNTNWFKLNDRIKVSDGIYFRFYINSNNKFYNFYILYEIG